MPPKKYQKVSKSQESVRATAARSESGLSNDTANQPEVNLFQKLPQDVHRYLLRFALSEPPEPTPWQYPCWELKEDHHSLCLVSKAWKTVVKDMINESAPEHILSPRNLSQIKSKVAALEFSGAVRQTFEKLLTEKWNLEDGAEWDEYPLSNIVSHFGGMKDFSSIVESEYKKFLVVKCVEYLAAQERLDEDVDEATAATLAVWQEKCQPSKLVDLFWHAHMLAPCKYQADCLSLVNGTIDHDAGYVSPNSVEGSDFKSKDGILFQFEKRFPKKDYFCGRLGNHNEGSVRMVFDDGSDRYPHDLAEAILADMFGANDCG